MSYEAKSLNEECGIFGIWGHPDAAQVRPILAYTACSIEAKKARELWRTILGN